MNFYCFKPPGLWQCVTAAPGHQHRDLGRQQPLSRYQPWEQQEGDGWVKAGERGCPAWPGVAQGELDSALEQTLLLPEPCTRPPPGPTPSGAASLSRGVTQKARPAETTDEPDSTPPRTLSGLATLGPTAGKVEAQGRRGGWGGGAAGGPWPGVWFRGSQPSDGTAAPLAGHSAPHVSGGNPGAQLLRQPGSWAIQVLSVLRTSTVTVCLNSHVTVRLVLSIWCTFECKPLPCLTRESSPPHGNGDLGAGGGPAWACFLICEMGIWTARVFPRSPIRGCCEHAEGVVGGCSAHSLLTGQGWERATFWLCSLGSHAGPRAQKGQNVV